MRGAACGRVDAGAGVGDRHHPTIFSLPLFFPGVSIPNGSDALDAQLHIGRVCLSAGPFGDPYGQNTDKIWLFALELP